SDYWRAAAGAAVSGESEAATGRARSAWIACPTPCSITARLRLHRCISLQSFQTQYERRRGARAMFRADQNRTLNVRLAAERALFVAAIALLALYTLWPWLPGNRRSAPRTLVVYGFSILSEAINQGIFPAFADEWKARTGETVELVSSFAGSGTITNQILLGVPAQVALLSSELDGWRLVDGGALSGPTWQTLPHGGVINRTPFVILVRPGNPHG